jgi:hypothetical protein
MRAALAAREDTSFVVVGRTSAATMSGTADAVAPLETERVGAFLRVMKSPPAFTFRKPIPTTLRDRISFTRTCEVTGAPENCCIFEVEIERFEERLRSGLLDAKQAKNATARLAEARDDLDEHDWDTIRRSLPAATPPSQPQPPEPRPGPLATRPSRAASCGLSSWSTDQGTRPASPSARPAPSSGSPACGWIPSS